MFGLTSNDNSITIKIDDYVHHFYIGCDYAISKQEAEQKIQMEVKDTQFTLAETPEKHSIYAQMKQPARIFRVDCKDAKSFRNLKAIKSFRLFNSDIDSKTRFLVDCGGVGCGWFRLSRLQTAELCVPWGVPWVTDSPRRLVQEPAGLRAAAQRELPHTFL